KSLKRQLLVNQFVLTAGCGTDTALHLLHSAHWQFETALSTFFQEANVQAAANPTHMMCTPTNTPATPPNFPDAMAMFARLKASDSQAGSPSSVAMATSPPGVFGQPWLPSPPTAPAGAPNAHLPTPHPHTHTHVLSHCCVTTFEDSPVPSLIFCF
uniref:UBA-like domain-containing protein n=1 Tax=Eptatretus burgeri TaxID=7764 RepID=A0A8C4QBH1_EPTBU